MTPCINGYCNSNTEAVWTVIANNVVCIIYVMIMVVIEPGTLDCNRDDMFACQNIPRNVTNLIMIISPCVLSFLTISVVLAYFVKKVSEKNKVGHAPAKDSVGIEMKSISDEETRPSERNVTDASDDGRISTITQEVEIRRKNSNPNQFFKVTVTKTAPTFLSPLQNSPIVQVAKRALNVNLLSLCQLSFLLTPNIIDVMKLVSFPGGLCDPSTTYLAVTRGLGFLGLFGSLAFPFLTEKKLDNF